MVKHARWIICFLMLITYNFEGDRLLAQTFSPIEITSSPNIVGSGARALGFSAFIAVADDATAASWNPGGLTQLQTPELSIVGAGVYRSENNHFTDYWSGASGPQSTTSIDLNYLSAAYPFNLFGINMIASLNYQELLNFGKEWDVNFKPPGSTIFNNRDIDFSQTGTLKAISPAFAVEIIDDLSVGFTLNFWTDKINFNGWKSEFAEKSSGDLYGIPFQVQTNSSDRYEFDGFNTNLGVLWNLTSQFTLGAVFKTPFTADVRHEHKFSQTIRFETSPDNNVYEQKQFEEQLKLEMPMAYGLGGAFRFSDRLTIALDISRIHWEDFVKIDSHGNKISAVTGLPEGQADVDSTTTVRLGGEYLFMLDNAVIPFRLGFFYDPGPAPENPDSYYGLSVGSGITIGRFVFDLAYQYRFGNDVTPATFEGFSVTTDVQQHTVYTSLIVHF